MDIQAGQVWIRKDKNVQVRIWQNPTGDSVYFEYKGNRHSRTMSIKDFLNEFVSLDSLSDVTKGTKWIAKKDRYLGNTDKFFTVVDVLFREGRITYNRGDSASRSHFQINMGAFKDKFEPYQGGRQQRNNES